MVTGSAWASLTADEQTVLAAEARAYADARSAQLRDDHVWATTAMAKDGLQVVAPSVALVAELRRQAAAARAALDGEFYPRALRLAVERAAAP